MDFVERLEQSENGSAYLIAPECCYFVVATLDNYRLYIYDNHNHEVVKVETDDELDEIIAQRGLGEENWTFV